MATGNSFQGNSTLSSGVAEVGPDRAWALPSIFRP